MPKTESSEKQAQPPYGSVKWYDDFFKLLERITIDKVNASFLKANKIASGNEYKLITGLKFLGLIDKDGKAKERMSGLRVVGEEFTKNFEKMVREAYPVLLKRITSLEKAEPQDVINCLITDYKMARSTATMGAKIFVFLAQKAEIPISESLAKLRTPELEVTRKRAKRKKREPKKTEVFGEKAEAASVAPEGMLKLEYENRFIMFLRKGDRSTRERVARIAKQLIDTYVEEEESETEEK